MKRFLCFILLVAASFSTRASHLMGGEIVAHYDTALNAYVITLTHYRDTLGIHMYTTADISIYQETTPGSWSLYASHAAPLNVALSTLLLPNFPYGVEVGVYTDTVVLPPGTYRILNDSCCRNGAILNMANPFSESMVLYTDLYVDAQDNSTPGFLAMPIAHFPQNQPAYYNPLPFDPDLDSLSWTLNTPISTHSYTSPSLVFTPVVGFVTPAADPSGPFTMNPVTGEITWTPDTVGNYVQSFEVNEIKNAIPTGRIIRDMQYVILPGGGNSSPNFQTITPFSVNNQQNYNYKYYLPGNQLIFQILGTDPDASTVELTAFSQAFKMANPATFSTFAVGNNLIGTFAWTPPAGFTKDMIVVFRVRDGLFTRDFTLLLRKGDVTSVNSIGGNVNNEISVFPNPASNKLTLSFNIEEEISGDVVLYSTLGQKVQTLFTGTISKGNTQLSRELNLAPGTYYLIVRDNGQAVKTLPVIIR